MRSDFVLVDLESQAEAVARYICGWTRARFLAWLSQFGEVRAGPYADTYFFRSHFGLHTPFRMSEEGDFILIQLAGPTMKHIADGLFSS
jgi:hypothetical protein